MRGEGLVVLNDLIDAWLNAPAHRFRLKFPPALEERFEADTGGDRSRSMAVFNALGFAFGLLLYPVLSSDMTDVAAQVRTYYLGLAIPVGFAVSALLWLQPRPAVREGLVLLANLITIVVGFALFSSSHLKLEPSSVAGVAVLMVYSAIGVQLRFGYALTALTVIVLAQELALQYRADIPAAERNNLLIMAAVTGAYLMLANWRLERGMRRGYLLILRERLQRQDLSVRNLELDELARRDPLTGLANRRAYDSWLATAWAQEGTSERPAGGRLGMIVLDIDRFKAFNDFYGHAAGDNCLKTIAICLREQLRGTSDLLARLGGEEFVVLLPGLSAELCADVAERMRLAVQRLELPHPGIGPHGLVSISAGVASHPVLPGTGPGHLFDCADSALYQAKIAGRDRVCVATLSTVSGIAEPVAD
jgi:diguanylate cyclase (GGDEF)-like protein